MSMTEPIEDPALRAHVEERVETLARVRTMLVERLKVPLEPDEIDLDAPLFGTGLGLDSVDAVELVVALESELGVILPEGSVGPWAFRTVHSLVELVLDPPLLEEAVDEAVEAPVEVPVDASPAVEPEAP